MLKQLQVSKQMAQEEEKEGRCGERNMTRITLKDMSGNF